MADALKGSAYLAGDSFSNADCAVIPYILRLELLKLDGMWAQFPIIADWWARMRARPSVKATIFDRMEEKDWAPFKNSRASSVAEGTGAAESSRVTRDTASRGGADLHREDAGTQDGAAPLGLRRRRGLNGSRTGTPVGSKSAALRVTKDQHAQAHAGWHTRPFHPIASRVEQRRPRSVRCPAG